MLLTEVQKIIAEQVALSDMVYAIENNFCIAFNYDGGGMRTVEPKLIGNTKSGARGIRAFQLTGNTKTGNNKWKIFLIDKMRNLKVLEKEQAPNRPNYNSSGDKEFLRIAKQQQ
jgi:hypothetical protein